MPRRIITEEELREAARDREQGNSVIETMY